MISEPCHQLFHFQHIWYIAPLSYTAGEEASSCNAKEMSSARQFSRKIQKCKNIDMPKYQNRTLRNTFEYKNANCCHFSHLLLLCVLPNLFITPHVICPNFLPPSTGPRYCLLSSPQASNQKEATRKS